MQKCFAGHSFLPSTFLFSGSFLPMHFSFCLDAKRNKKIKANAKLRRFAVPAPP